MYCDTALLTSQSIDRDRKGLLQVIDRLCASALYREAMVCESRTATVSTPQTVLKVCVVVQNAYHEVPVELQERHTFDLRSQSAKVLPSSPTAVQRLAKLSASSQNPMGAHGHFTSKKHAHKRKQARHLSSLVSDPAENTRAT